ncbi:hypothetical protein FPSE_02422 [Fusarium pseudograminearum CS3096]|uniref:Uncharacterized protein n=1 Tax=Fusarium pseudograminearum (strain CS3096) TaxID=1028729 RepID=K3VQP3_FUSPC|nr:hypothetical protein FPSE_02422 [Fusarium pseudograminearum CS3096]EKJ77344.1 hypothetical protein FPSE_02422 [Fusarium pseudograminearum CS3096]
MQFQLTTLLVLLAAGFHAVEANKCLYNPARLCSEGCPNGGCTVPNSPGDNFSLSIQITFTTVLIFMGVAFTSVWGQIVICLRSCSERVNPGIDQKGQERGGMARDVTMCTVKGILPG